MKHEESEKNNKDVIDYIAKLCKKNKIVWLNDLHKSMDKNTPEFVRMKYLGGTLKLVLNSSYALGNDLRCVSVELGEVRKKSLIVFNTKHEAYVKRCLKDFKLLKDELIQIEKDHAVRVDALKRKMLKIGGRFN